MNGLMLGMMYALVAVGFTLFFGVLDVINFSHGDVLMVGTFTGLETYLGLSELGVVWPAWQVTVVLAVATVAMAALGAVIARYLVLPLKSAPPLNTLLITLMLGTVLREAIRLFYPQGANPKRFPSLLPTDAYEMGNFNLRADNVIMLLAGFLVIIGLHLLINRTKLGLAIRAVAQDEETAKTMGINFTLIVLIAFAIGSSLAAFAGILNGLYYNEINFGVGLLLGVIGFSAAIIGGLGNIWGALLGGLILGLAEALSAGFIASYMTDVVVFVILILVLFIRPEGLLKSKV
jgi:branched-chain amino acid transport system permease protein